MLNELLDFLRRRKRERRLRRYRQLLMDRAILSSLPVDRQCVFCGNEYERCTCHTTKGALMANDPRDEIRRLLRLAAPSFGENDVDALVVALDRLATDSLARRLAWSNSTTARYLVDTLTELKAYETSLEVSDWVFSEPVCDTSDMMNRWTCYARRDTSFIMGVGFTRDAAKADCLAGVTRIINDVKAALEA